MLEDALGARVMDELAAADEPFSHRHFAPGTKAVGKVGGGWSVGIRLRGIRVRHARHFLRRFRLLSTNGVTIY
ncbi:MAG: hypothetical protein ACT4OO_09780 [Nitrospiraceae bacterium]